MDILYKRKVLLTIKTVQELEEFLIKENIFSFFKKINKDFYNEINLAINSTDFINYKQIKPWLRNLLNYPESIYNPFFLKCMGWEIDEINNFITQKQKNNANKIIENKRNNPEKYSAITSNQIGFWIKKGYSEEESKEKVKERQKTFSKEICIKKYGEKKGLEKFKSRQEKWINTLKSRSDYQLIQERKNSYNYESKNYNDLIIRSSFLDKTKNLILSGLTYNSVEEYINLIIKNLDIKKFSELHPYINSKIVQTRFLISKSELQEKFTEKLPFNPFESKFGTIIYYNKKRFKSFKEYTLALFFDKNKIEYYYEIPYPYSIRKCDFYLPKFNLYIEYFGMLDGKLKIKNGSIFDFYKKKMEEKINYCNENKINLIYDINFDKLLEKIKLII